MKETESTDVLNLLLYGAGISALASAKYDNLAAMLLTSVGSSRSATSSTSLTLAIGDATKRLHDVFKQLPGHERQYVPRSEYLFKLLQPTLDDLLFVGRDYERDFDRFELLLALVHADLASQEARGIWGPPGRFGWKFHNHDANPLRDLIGEAEGQKESWGPLKAGLFGGDYARFERIASEYAKWVARLDWG